MLYFSSGDVHAWSVLPSYIKWSLSPSLCAREKSVVLWWNHMNVIGCQFSCQADMGDARALCTPSRYTRTVALVMVCSVSCPSVDRRDQQNN